MSVYGELDPMVEHRIQFAFRGKREHIAKVIMPNIVYRNTTWFKRSFNCNGSKDIDTIAHAWFKRH